MGRDNQLSSVGAGGNRWALNAVGCPNGRRRVAVGGRLSTVSRLSAFGGGLTVDGQNRKMNGAPHTHPPMAALEILEG